MLHFFIAGINYDSDFIKLAGNEVKPLFNAILMFTLASN